MKLLGALALLAPLAAASVIHAPQGAAPRDSKVNYDGYRVYSIDTASAPRDIETQLLSYYSQRSPKAIEVAIPPNDIKSFEALGLEARLLNEDLGKVIRDESLNTKLYNSVLTKRGELPDLGWFDSYHAYDDHLQYWSDLQAAFPENSELFDVGLSYEGRKIFGLQLWGDKGVKGTKPIIYWHGTVHAREWITTMVVEYLTYQLIDGYKSRNQNVTTFLDEYDFYIVPFHNPDGFVYTQTNDRLWRKNRQPRLNTTCIGTDGNRNWNYKWDYPLDDGSVSSNPCGQTFKGRCAGDTPENIVLSALSKKLAASPGGIRSFIDWHSYSQLILLPWGWSCEPEDLPENLPRQREVGGGLAATIAAFSGEEYVVGPSCEVLYYSTGSARDYHQGRLNATFAWSIELRPKDNDSQGFVLRPEFIWPTVKEHWEGVKYVLDAVR